MISQPKAPIQEAERGFPKVQSRTYIALFLMALLGTAFLFGFLLKQSYNQARDKANSDITNLSWVLESHLSTSLRRLDSDLQQVVKRVRAKDLESAYALRNRERWQEILEDLKTNFPEVVDFYLVDANGDVIYKSGKFVTFNVADRSHFKQLSSDPADVLAFTEVVVARDSGRPTIAFARGIRDAQGKFLGLVSVLVNLDYFQKLFASVDLGSGGVVGVRSSETNKLVLRQPPIPSEVNKATRSSNFDRIRKGEKIGYSLFTSPLDGSTRFTIFRLVEGFPFFIYIALDEKDVLADFRLQMYVSSAIGGTLLLVIAFVLWRLWHAEASRLQALQQAVVARDMAEEASQSKGQFLANMSHEIRTPMNAILGLLKLLQATELTSRQRDYASKTEGAAQSLLGLLNDILDFSKVEAGKMNLEIEPLRIDHLLRNLSVVLSSNVGNKDVEVLYDIDPHLPKLVLGDAMRLQQVLINLGGNAVKFTMQGQVVLALRKTGQTESAVTIEFSVKDSGIGIAPEHREHIFTGFSQAEGSTTRRFGGTGLGLAISQRLVNLMGSEIRIDSVLGQGSRFYFEVMFPIVHDMPDDLKLDKKSAIQVKRVLVIDDNAISRELMQAMLESWGWTADLATSGEQALQLIALHQKPAPDGFPYDLIYVDWLMPNMDGWETSRRIVELARRQRQDKPTIIMVTGNGRETLSQRTVDEQDLLGGFLVKPVTASMLLDAFVEAGSSSASIHEPADQNASERLLEGMRILVVEDNLINQQVAEELLSAAGAHVSLAANGQIGVDAVRLAAPQFDAVLMDIQMPVLDGYAATRLIRQELGLTDLPVIAMTANAMPSDRQTCLDAGMNEHIGKPFDMSQLVSLLVRMTGIKVQKTGSNRAPVLQDDSANLPEIAGLDFSRALARMSGLRSLYARTARSFDLLLDSAEEELSNDLKTGDFKNLVLRLHTLKGNAGTLGVTELAAKAAAMEKRFKAEDGRANPEEVLREMVPLIQKAKTLLRQAIDALASDAAVASDLGPQVLNKAKALEALGELDALAVASDLSVLQRFAELRDHLIGLPQGPADRLEEAMQNLDLNAAHAVMSEMMAQIDSA